MPNAFSMRTEHSPLLHKLKLSWEDAPETPTAHLTLMKLLDLTTLDMQEN